MALGLDESGQSARRQTCGYWGMAGADRLAHNFRKTVQNGKSAVIASGLSLALTGCAAPAIGALTVGEVLTIAGLSSAFLTGRDLGEHALSAATGKDCRFLESALRSDRGFCEDHGSAATGEDFGGLIALLEPRNNEGTVLAAAPAAPNVHGFTPIDRERLARTFTLDRAAAPAKGEHKAPPVSFGFLQSSYGQTWTYEAPEEKKLRVAEAKPRPAPQPLPAVRSDGQVIYPEVR